MLKIVNSREYKMYKEGFDKSLVLEKEMQDLVKEHGLEVGVLNTKIAELQHSNGGLTTSKNRLEKTKEQNAELINTLKTQVGLLEKEKEDLILKINNLDSQLKKGEELNKQLTEKVKNFEKRPTIEELKTEKMNKVDRTKMVGFKKKGK